MIFLTTKDIEKIAEVNHNKALKMKNITNEKTKEMGYLIVSDRTCLASVFCTIYGTTMEQIERRLSE